MPMARSEEMSGAKSKTSAQGNGDPGCPLGVGEARGVAEKVGVQRRANWVRHQIWRVRAVTESPARVGPQPFGVTRGKPSNFDRSV